MKYIKIRDRMIKDFGEPYIIAEIASNHNGDMKLAEELIRKAKKAGCDCVKFQSWTKDTIFSKKVYEDNYFLKDDYRNRTDYTLEQIVEKFSVSQQHLLQLKEICDQVDIEFVSTPFSKREVDFLVDNLNVSFIKVASMDLNNYPFLDYISRKQVPIVLSTGLSDINEIDKAVQVIEGGSNHQIILLHCVSIYPPEDIEVNLNNIDMLRQRYGYPVGFSDHTLGTCIPLAAVAKGACLIEKHFTLDKSLIGWDHKISANYKEIQQIVAQSKRIHKALGSYERRVSEKELKKREAFRRSIVAARNIPKEKAIEIDDIDFKRPGTGLEPGMIDQVLGRTVKRDIHYDELIKKDDLLNQ